MMKNCCRVMVLVIGCLATNGNSFSMDGTSNISSRFMRAKRNMGGTDNVLCDCIEYTFHHPRKNFANAKAYCENQGGFLAIIRDKETDDALRQQIINVFESQGLLQGNGYWIGLTYNIAEDTFYWVNGDTLIPDCSYDNWAGREPNHKTKLMNGVMETQACGQLWRKKNFKWDDDYCSKTKSFICMKSVCPDDQGCTTCVP